jgi:hypothetical protein
MTFQNTNTNTTTVRSHSVIVQKCAHYSLTIRVEHILLLHSVSDPAHTTTARARQLATLAIGTAAPAITLALRAFAPHRSDALPAPVLRASALARHLRAHLHRVRPSPYAQSPLTAARAGR